MNRIIGAGCALLLALSLAACGGGGKATSSAAFSSTAAASEAAAPMEGAPPMDVANTSAEAGEVVMIPQGDGQDMAPVSGLKGTPDESAVPRPPDNRKIIRHMKTDLETREFDNALAQIRDSVARAGGYIEQENVSGHSLWNEGKGGRGGRSAYLMARIPSEKLDGVSDALPGFCNVVRREESTDDVTERYFDSQAHLKSLELQEERLLVILEKAEKLEDVVTLEQALSDVRYEIETITAALRRIDSQVAYSYLEMNLEEVVTYTQVQETPKTFGQELSAAFAVSAWQVTDTAKSLLLGLIEEGPVFLLMLAVWVIPILLVLWAARFVLRKCGVENRFTRRLRKQHPPRGGDQKAEKTPESPESGKESDPGETK